MVFYSSLVASAAFRVAGKIGVKAGFCVRLMAVNARDAFQHMRVRLPVEQRLAVKSSLRELSPQIAVAAPAFKRSGMADK